MSDTSGTTPSPSPASADQPRRVKTGDSPKAETTTGSETGPAEEVVAPAGPTDELEGDELFAAARRKSPHLTREFMQKHDYDDDYLRRLARGEEPPAPYNGPDFSATDLHKTPGGWQNVPAGMDPKDVGKDQIHSNP